MDKIKIGFIGAGNMARALIGGLVNSGVPANNVYSFDPDEKRLDSLRRDYAIHAAADNQALLAQCDVVVLAVKPQVMHRVIGALNVDTTS
jgi:pyrroline-5-carboxylate reductase